MILAFGCSVTHGAELEYPNQHDDNILNSYPQLVANYLDVSCVNHAICGISNEGIFHKLLDTVANYQTGQISAVIVGWTSNFREYWQCDDRSWFIIPSWCATSKDIKQPYKFFTDYTDKDINQYPRVCSDDLEYMDQLGQLYELITKYKFDAKEYIRKKQHYIDMTRLYCQSRDIKLIETSCMYSVDDISIHIDNIGNWRSTLGHPTKDDHQEIAKNIIKAYKL